MGVKYLIDIGSSTIKIYLYRDNKLIRLTDKKFRFKHNSNKETDLSIESKIQLYQFFNELIAEFSLTKINTKIFATGVFRTLSPKCKHEFIHEFYNKTGLLFNIISHELESFYLEKACTGKCSVENNVLLINIGGRSTELVVMKNNKVFERKNIKYGIGKILNEFIGINEIYSKISLDSIVRSIKLDLPDIMIDLDYAIYTGGELTYMQKAYYKLEENKYFIDEKHPYMINLECYKKRNEEIFEKISLSKLRSFMPENPSWMDGARACSAIAQAICEKYSIKSIIPSDSNLMDGVCVQEFRNIAICGDIENNIENILTLMGKLDGKDIDILNCSKSLTTSGINTSSINKGHDVRDNNYLFANNEHLTKFNNCDGIVVINYYDKISHLGLFELGYAIAQGKKIVFLENNLLVEKFNLPCEVGLILS